MQASVQQPFDTGKIFLYLQQSGMAASVRTITMGQVRKRTLIDRLEKHADNPCHQAIPSGSVSPAPGKGAG